VCFSFCSWLPSLELPSDTGKVDLSNVVLSNGRGLVGNKTQCLLCGLTGGLKIKCDREGCCMSSDDAQQTSFHVTCARQAGLEVRVDDRKDIYFYGTILAK
jgi:PHD-zinc-finger like domain